MGPEPHYFQNASHAAQVDSHWFKGRNILSQFIFVLKVTYTPRKIFKRKEGIKVIRHNKHPAPTFPPTARGSSISCLVLVALPFSVCVYVYKCMYMFKHGDMFMMGNGISGK